MMNDESRIRSFVRREGRITPSQKRALKQLWPKYGLTVESGYLDSEKTFGRCATLVLEIGFGMGESLLAMAKANPETNYIGIEVHRPGIGALLSALAKEQIDNVRIYQEDAISVLTTCIKNKSLDTIQIFFPDPWPKKRHHKRRLIQPVFLDLVYQKLKEGGQLHLVTDWEDYAKYIMDILTNHPGFKNEVGEGQFVVNKGFTQGAKHLQKVRPETKFERRGQRLGHSIWEMLFKK